jgi:pyrroloquinoline quinone (PQQ) biosynthesis protein C
MATALSSIPQPIAADHHVSSRAFLTDLASTVYRSGALNNAFYDAWTSRALPIDDIAITVRNYGYFVRSFPEILATMIMSADNVVARTEYAKTLFSEMGYGQLRAVHSVLLDKFFSELSAKLGEPERLTQAGLASVPLLPEAVALVDGEKALYSSNSARAAGAQLALEWQAYTMLRKLYDGACHYRALWSDEDEFHGACEYFYAHIGAAEKEHKLESLNGAVELDTDPAAREQIVLGFHEHLVLFDRFWNAIAAAFSR